MQSKSPSVVIPQYNAPTPMSFNTPYGNVSNSGGAYTYTPSGAQADQTTNITNLQNSLMGMMSQTPQQQLANQQQWQNAFMQQATQNTMPALTNQMFNQGLGGSSVYGSSMANLLSNLGSQSVLNAQNLNLADQSSLQGLYGQLQNTQNSNMGYAGNLMQMAGNYNLNQNQQAQQLYQAQLPYEAYVNVPKQPWYMNGLQGIMSGNGAIDGIINGDMSNQGTQQPYSSYYGANSGSGGSNMGGMGGNNGFSSLMNSMNQPQSSQVPVNPSAYSAASTGGYGGYGISSLLPSQMNMMPASATNGAPPLASLFSSAPMAGG